VITRLDVDGVVYDLDYRGHDRPLVARTADGELHLQPWRLGQHLAALGHAARVDEHGLVLDAETYAAHVLGGAELVALWGPLALWWAAGAVDAPPEQASRPLGPEHDVRPWSLLARASAVQAALDRETGAFAVGRYLARLVADCISISDRSDPLALPMLSGAPLLAAACRACAPEPLLPPALADPALRRLTLRVCTALGWSPAQVWRAPAEEVDRLIALLDQADSGAPRRSPSVSALAGLADTHTLHFDD